MQALAKTSEAALIWLSEKARREKAALAVALKNGPVAAALLQVLPIRTLTQTPHQDLTIKSLTSLDSKDAGMHHEGEIVAGLGKSGLALWELLSRVTSIIDRIEALNLTSDPNPTLTRSGS